MTYLSVNEETSVRLSNRNEQHKIPLARHVAATLEDYFQDLDGYKPDDLYRMVISEVEKPLLEIVMQQVRGNQSKASAMLGITRSTLRKKLQHHNLD